MPAICYYISGHGFGHARRSVAVAKALVELRPDLEVHLRSAASPAVFTGLGPRLHYQHVEIDRGVIESTALALDWDQTIASVRQLVDEAPRLASREAAFLRRAGVSLIIADVPWLAGYVAAEARLPCYAACNFLWDWIYAPHLRNVPGGEHLRSVLAGGYQRMSGWLRLPFPHACNHFRDIVDVPFLAVPGSAPLADTLARLKIAPTDQRPRVLVAMRGSGAELVAKAAAADASLLYLVRGTVPDAPGNLRILTDEIEFSDALAAADIAISKLGHGIVTDCIATGVRLLWPPRNGFAEDAMLATGLAHYVASAEFPLADYERAHWPPHLRRLLQQPARREPARTDGVNFLANWISRRA